MPDYSAEQHKTLLNVGSGGVRYDRQPWNMEADEWQEALNVQFIRGGVERVLGWSALGPALPDISVDSDNLPVAASGFVDEGANRRAYVVATNRRIYKRAPTDAGAWPDILGADFTIPLISASTPAPNVSFELYRGTMYIAAGSNAIRTWDGVALLVGTLGGSPPQCRDFVIYGERGLMARLLSGSPASSSEYRWSDQGNPASGWSSTNSARAEKIPYTLMRMKRTGSHILLFKTGGIERMLITPSSVTPFSTDIVESGVGMTGANAIASYNNEDFFVSLQSIFRFQDGRLVDIGLPVMSKVLTAGQNQAVGGFLTYGDPTYDEVAFHVNDGFAYTYSPLFNTWSRRDFGGLFAFITPGYDLNASQDRNNVNRTRSILASTVVTPKQIYILDGGNTYPAGFPTTSNAKKGWWDNGTPKKKRWLAYQPLFRRNTGTTMTINVRIYNNTTDVAPAAILNQNYVTRTLVLDGSDTLINLQNMIGRWVETEYVNNNNSQPWQLLGERFVFQEESWN